jgi:hypothetical protein
MKTTTLLEVMAEVGIAAEENKDLLSGAEDLMDMVRLYVSEADARRGAQRRSAMSRIAAYAILALHAHDAEAAKAGS